MTRQDPERPLNATQQRRLRVTCEHIDHVLSEMETALAESGSKKAFPVYTPDITVDQQRLVEEYIALIRRRLMQTLETQGISSNPPGIPLSRAIQSRLCTIDIAAEEIRPRHMRGYGAVSAAAATELGMFAEEMQERANELHQLFMQDVSTIDNEKRKKGGEGKRERRGSP